MWNILKNNKISKENTKFFRFNIAQLLYILNIPTINQTTMSIEKIGLRKKIGLREKIGLRTEGKDRAEV